MIAQKRKNKRKQRLWIVEMLLCAAFAALLVLIIARLCSSAETTGEEKAAAQAHEAMAATANDDAPQPEVRLQPEIAALMQQNADAVGLLHFEGDRTLYVCQAADNSYYMNHRFDHSEDPAGMIYMDCRNMLNPRSDNLILYGHNMRNGSRFGTLRRFEKPEYIKQYPVFQLADRYETVDYIPFAVFHTTVLPDMAEFYPFDQTNFSGKADFDRYIEDVKARSVVDIPLEVKYGDKLLTLATCHSGLERGRLVIVCREIKPGEIE